MSKSEEDAPTLRHDHSKYSLNLRLPLNVTIRAPRYGDVDDIEEANPSQHVNSR